MNTFLAIDAGTTSLKAAVFNQQGQMLAISRQEYRLSTPCELWVEIEPETYWQACCLAVRQVLENSGVDAGTVATVCISSQGETLIPVDANGKPTRNAIVWLDNRAEAQAQTLRERFGQQDVYLITGQPEIAPTWPACKILWVRENEPGIFGRTEKFLLLEDFLLYKLTGRYITESALQTSSLLYDINQHAWWRDMLNYLEIQPSSLGELMFPGEIVGELTPQAAEATGLNRHTLAVSGGMDQVVGALGAGNFQPGIISETTGGALGIVASLENPVYNTTYRLPCHCHVTQNGYCLLPWGQTAGMALTWFRNQFYALETTKARETGIDPYDLMTAEAAAVPPGSDGLVTLPHLEGAACPEFNPHARGVFYGATLRHTRAHFVRSLMESVAYMLRKNLDIVEKLGVEVQEVRSMGGGARSPLWLQIKADLLQKPVVRLENEETGLLGAAILGTAALGVYPDLKTAVEHMVRISDRIQPDAKNFPAYENGYNTYLELYERLQPMFTG